jgi:hypothetical protein
LSHQALKPSAVRPEPAVNLHRLTLSGAVISSRQNDVSAMVLSPVKKARRQLQGCD